MGKKIKNDNDNNNNDNTNKREEQRKQRLWFTHDKELMGYTFRKKWEKPTVLHSFFNSWIL